MRGGWARGLAEIVVDVGVQGKGQSTTVVYASETVDRALELDGQLGGIGCFRISTSVENIPPVDVTCESLAGHSDGGSGRLCVRHGEVLFAPCGGHGAGGQIRRVIHNAPRGANAGWKSTAHWRSRSLRICFAVANREPE